MKIRDAKPEELVQPGQARKLSPRQKVAQEREATFRKLLEGLSDPAQIKAIEPEKGEKLGTLGPAICGAIVRKSSSTKGCRCAGSAMSSLPPKRSSRAPRAAIRTT